MLFLKRRAMSLTTAHTQAPHYYLNTLNAHSPGCFQTKRESVKACFAN